MQSPAIFRIVDGAGTVHHANLTSSQADAFMGLMLGGGQFSSLRTERMDAAPAADASAATPATVIAQAAEQAISKAIANIEPGAERDVLREAIEARRNASDCLAEAAQAVERAKAFVNAKQLEVDVLTTARDNEIKMLAGFLTEALKDSDNDGTITTYGRIDSSAIANAENICTAARGALDDLTAEQEMADTAFKSAESAVRLASMAVKRADVAAMVKRLQEIRAEFVALGSAIDAARFAEVPMSIEASEAMRLPNFSGYISANVTRWHAYTAALRENPQSVWEDQQ